MKEWSEIEINEAIENKESFCLYLYTPLCGTCQVASKMLYVVNELVESTTIAKSDLNYMPMKAMAWEVESVPCLLLFKNGEVEEKIYAFHSVPYLLETIKFSY